MNVLREAFKDCNFPCACGYFEKNTEEQFGSAKKKL